MKPPSWRLDFGCRGPLCKHIGPGGGGCLGICNLFKCHIGCRKKGGGDISDDDLPPPDPEDPEVPRNTTGAPPPTPGPSTEGPEISRNATSAPQTTAITSTEVGTTTELTSSGSGSGRECETIEATQVTELCNVITQLMGKRDGSTLSAPRTTCTSTRRHVTFGCEVTPGTTTILDSCTMTQTATDFTKFCTVSISAGLTHTPCTKTVSTVVQGCLVTATTTSVIDNACKAKVTFAPDDPQGEFGFIPANNANDTCPFFPGLNVTALDDQGSDGQEQNDTCQMPNGTRTSIDDDQGDGEVAQSCGASNGTMADGPSCPTSNATLVQGPDGAEDGIESTNGSCSLNNTISIEPDGALDNDTAPSCSISPEVDNEQGEDGEGGHEQSCPVVPDGMIISPLADLGDYAPTNGSCPLLDGRFPISWLDEQGDDWITTGGSCPVPNITIEPLPDDPEESGDSSPVRSSDWSSLLSDVSQMASSACQPPQISGLGSCSLVFAENAVPEDMEAVGRLQTMDPASALTHITALTATSGLSTYPWSCSCAFQTSGKPVVNVVTVCSTLMCPNFASEIDITLTTTRNTDPLFTFTVPKETSTEHSTSECEEPYDPQLGQCTLMTVGTWEGVRAHTTLPNYCVCADQGTSTVDLTKGCDGTLVCPNQRDLVTGPASGILLPETACLTQLPSLSFFRSCGLTMEHGEIFCACNGNDKEASIWTVEAITRPEKCRGYLCPNSMPFKMETFDRHINEAQQAPAVTRVDSLVTITTDATPGSIPTAAKHTRATERP